MLPPRDPDDVWLLIQSMESYYKGAFNNFREDDLFYEGEIDLFFQTPAGFDITVPTTARAVVDEAVDNAAPSDLLVAYSPRKRTKKAEEDADAVRLGTKNLWRWWRTHSNDIDIVRDFLKNLFKSGKACFKIAPDWSLWPALSPDVREGLMKDGGKEAVLDRVTLLEKVRGENTPLYCRSIPPSCIMESPHLGRKLWIIERYQATYEEIRDTYALLDEDLNYPWNTVGYRVYEYWSATYVDRDGSLQKGKHMVFINAECVKDVDNPYDELPYVVKYSGYGRESYEGRPEYKSVGFYTRPNKSMFLAEMRRFTHLEAIMSQLAFPIAFLSKSAESPELSFAPGAVNFVDDDTLMHIDKMWVQPAIPDAEYISSLNTIAAQIERGTVQRALRGANPQGANSGAQYGMMNSQAKLRIESAVAATEQAMSLISELALYFIDKILEDDISIYIAENRTERTTLGPNNIKGHYTVDVHFQPNEEAIKERKLVLAADAIAKGVMSPYDALVYAGFDNPSEIIQRMLAYKVLEDPIIMRAMAKEALNEWGFDADQLEMDERIKDAEKQFALREMINQLQLGTMRGVGDPMSANGSPPPAPPETPNGPAGAGLPLVAQGAPAAVQSAPVQAAAQDIQSLQGQANQQ